MILKVGIFCLDGRIKLRIPAIVGVGAIEVVFVTDFDIAKCEGRGVAIARAGRSPLRFGAARDVFNLLLPERRARGRGPVLQAVPGELQIGAESQAVHGELLNSCFGGLSDHVFLNVTARFARL